MKRFFFLILTLLVCACATAPKEPVTYATVPAAAEEQAVATTLETMITSYNAQDIKKHLACYAPDARIDSKLAGGFVTRDEYRETLGKQARRSTLRLKDTKISKVSDDKYRVDAVLSAPRGNYPILYDFVPIEGRWLVIEQRYK
jgi:hypothetical protein